MTPAELRAFRTEHGFRQVDLAELLHVSRLCIWRWENGSRHVPPYLTLQVLECVLRSTGEPQS